MSKLADFVNESLKTAPGCLDRAFHFLRATCGAFGQELASHIAEHASDIPASLSGEPSLDAEALGADFCGELIGDLTEPEAIALLSDECVARALDCFQLESARRARKALGPTDI